MRRKSYPEEIACFVCDYWYLILIFLGLIFWGLWLLTHTSPSTTVPPIPTSTPQPATTQAATTPTSQPSTSTPTPGPTATPTATPVVTPANPIYIFGFIPVNFSGSDEEFEILANDFLNYFIAKSGMDQYFEIRIQILNELTGIDVIDENILNELAYYGINEYPADRYIGITSHDIILDGDDSVVGFTQGNNAYAVISEAEGSEIVTHELGHTFGLCDEYSYEAWMYQNEEMPGGCPNPLASSCERNAEYCLGVPTEDGANSIMGLAGLPGRYAFNPDCYNHLKQQFQYLAESEIQ